MCKSASFSAVIPPHLSSAALCLSLKTPSQPLLPLLANFWWSIAVKQAEDCYNYRKKKSAFSQICSEKLSDHCKEGRAATSSGRAGSECSQSHRAGGMQWNTFYHPQQLFQVVVFFAVVYNSFNREDELRLNLRKSVQYTLGMKRKMC